MSKLNNIAPVLMVLVLYLLWSFFSVPAFSSENRRGSYMVGG
jgi:hypothetical protein